MECTHTSRRWIAVIVFSLVGLGGALSVSSAPAASLEPLDDFSQPTYVTSDTADPDRLLVAERLGTIKLVDHGTVSTFADISSVVGCTSGSCSGERGLMSIALAPDFSDSGHLYVFYAQEGSGDLRIAELTASGDEAPLASLRPVISIPHSDDDNHNGGQLQFGPEGNLFIATGDGGGSNDVHHQSQDLSTLLGKILRIDPEQNGSDPYTVPAGNPFPAATAPANTIWSYGLRNPFRFSFDRVTGGLLIGDVGQGAREEVDYAPPALPGVAGGAGANYGWNCREGLIAGPATDLPGEGCRTTPFADPVFDYPHNDPENGSAHGCSIIGGFVARDPSLGAGLYGRYLYADLCIGDIRSLKLPATVPGEASDDRSEGIPAGGSFISFGEDSCHRLYAIVGSSVSRLVGATPAVCPPPEGEPPAEEEPPPGKEQFKGTGSGGNGQIRNLSTLPPNPIVTGVRLKAADLRVEAGARASLTAQVLPCAGRDGQRVQLYRGGRRLQSAPLDRNCRARFDPRVRHRSTFRVRVRAFGSYLAARSPRLTVEVD